MKKNLSGFLLLCQLFYAPALLAQNSYSFSKTTGNLYADLDSDTTVPGFDPGTGLYTFTNFQNETFKVFDLDFTFGGLKTIAMGEYPFLRIDNDSSLIIVDAAFAYIDPIDPNSRTSYLIEGSPGDWILKLQYRNFKFRSGQPGNFMNVQIWFYQKTGVIEIHYGPRSANNASGYNTVNGPNVGIFYSPLNFSKCYEKLWVNGSPANFTLDSAATLVFKAMSGIAAEGTIYRFTPRFIQPETTSTNEQSALPEMTVSPNPAENELIVNGNLKNARISLSGVNGIRVKHVVHSNTSTLINLEDLPPGIYTLMIESSNGSSFKKISILR